MSDHTPYNYRGYPRGFKYPWTYPMASEKERDRRWAAIRRKMSEHEIDCLVVAGNNGNYLVNCRYSMYVSNYVPYFGNALVVFPLEREPLLSVPADIGPQFIHCASEVSWIREISGELDQSAAVVRKLIDLKLEKGKIGIIGYNDGIFPASVYDSLRQALPNVNFLIVSDLMNEVMRTPSEEELVMVRKSASIADLSFNAVVNKMHSGVKEYELWAAAENAILNAGAMYPNFVLATSGNGPLFPRSPPSHNVLTKGDIVIFEINVLYGGCSTQICYAVCLGSPQAEIGKMYDFCSKLYDIAIKQLKAKKKYGEVESDLARRIHEAGYEPMTPQVHILGKSVRMPYEEEPKAGDYFTVHPAITDVNYTKGAKFGDTVLVGKDGRIEHLMKTPCKLNIVPV